jgi:hypothetical protein
MSYTSQSPTQTQESKPALMIALLFLSIIITVLVFILYLPTLTAPALYDENYLLAWWKNLLQAGLFSHESLAFLNFRGCDWRDGTGPFGNLATLIFAAVTGGKIAFMHFLSVALHTGNSMLLFAASLKVQSLGSHNDKIGGDKTGSDETSYGSATTDAKIGNFASSAIAALLFALSPLAPEAVSWLGGFPIHFGTALSLIAFLLLSFATSSNNKRNILLSGCAGALALTASLCSAHLAVVVFLPALCLYFATRKLATNKKQIQLVLGVYLVGALIGALYSSVMYFTSSPSAVELPPKVTALREHQPDAQPEVQVPSLLSSSLGNISALVIPINRSINKTYNKTFKLSYLLIPAPLVFSVLALVLSVQFRNRIGIVFGFALVYLLLNNVQVERETLVGARWLYPILPTFSFLVASTLASPLFIQWNKAESNLVSRIIKGLVCAILVILTLLFLIPLTHTQISSYKSQGKLWTKLGHSLEILSAKEKSAYLIVRNLPQSLSIAPIISPFEPILLDATEKLPRSQNISAGGLKDCLRDTTTESRLGKLAYHFEKHLVDLIKTDFKAPNTSFGQRLTAQQIAKRVTPPLDYYRGTVKLDSTAENLLLESGNTNGAAVRIDCEGLSPVDGDYLYVEAKIDGPPLKPHTPIEIHWLTNWNTDWEPRDRKTQVDAISNDNQYHHYFFPLRTTAWSTNGYPTHIMFGFPAGANVQVRALGIASKPITSDSLETATMAAPPAPLLAAQASVPQSQKRRFAAFCFDYPDLKELGLTAVYGRDNTLILNYDASTIDTASSVKFEIGRADSKFTSDNAEYAEVSSTTVDQGSAKGSLILKSTDQPLAKAAANGSVFPIRVFALDKSGKIIGRSSDSVHCLIDWNLSAK